MSTKVFVLHSLCISFPVFLLVLFHLTSSCNSFLFLPFQVSLIWPASILFNIEQTDTNAFPYILILYSISILSVVSSLPLESCLLPAVYCLLFLSPNSQISMSKLVSGRYWKLSFFTSKGTCFFFNSFKRWF